MTSPDCRLWHQLTLAIQEMILLPSSASHLVSLYDNFIRDWEKKMNPISLVHYLALACQQKGGLG